MATVIFDFDSTLIARETLDVVLGDVLAARSDDAARVREITRDGMEGRIGFRESVEQRLAIAKPKRTAIEEFGATAIGLLTPGIADLARRLQAECWIVSGAPREALLPVARHLGIAAERVLGVRLEWEDDGTLLGLLECPDKVELVTDVAAGWTAPRIAIGDGMSDHALKAAGVVDHFVAYTEHARRAAVVATGAPEARNVSELTYLLKQLLP